MTIEPDSVEAMLVEAAKHRAREYVQGYEDGARAADPLIAQAYRDGHHDGALIGATVANGTCAMIIIPLSLIILILMGCLFYPHVFGHRISLGFPLLRM